MIVINDSPLKLIMENEHGVGPTVVEGFMRATNLLVPARSFVVFGYGSVGRGIAKCLRALGGRVTVVEPDAIRALEAALDGMQVSGIEQAFTSGEVFITATGRPGVILREHFERLPDSAILVNAGHFSGEIDIAALYARLPLEKAPAFAPLPARVRLAAALSLLIWVSVAACGRLIAYF